MKSLVMVCVVCLLVGCAPIREFGINLAEEEVKNSKAIQEASLKLIEAWPTISGLVRGYLGEDINQLPVSVVAAMDELDTLAEQTEWSENDLGRIAGLRLKLCSEFVRRVLTIYAPEVLLYLI